MWANFEQVNTSGKVRAFADIYRVENQAGERVGVAVAPRLGSLQTATPTAKGNVSKVIMWVDCEDKGFGNALVGARNPNVSHITVRCM